MSEPVPSKEGKKINVACSELESKTDHANLIDRESFDKQVKAQLQIEETLTVLNPTTSFREERTQHEPESGQSWAHKLSKDDVSEKTLQTLVTVLKQENEQFVTDFQKQLGLKHICRLGKSNTILDLHLLNVLKGIYNCEQSTKSLINHDLAIRMIVQKINSNEIRVRELALELLVVLMHCKRVSVDLISKAAHNISSCMFFLSVVYFEWLFEYNTGIKTKQIKHDTMQ